MTKKQFQAESKRILELMVHSIYTHKDIFLRELISNASDAIDKMYYRALSDEAIDFNKDDYFIKVELDKDARTITIRDTGIGMTADELESNLGIIAKSGSLAMKQATKMEEDHSLIGQFGVGFYSAFMVADRVTVRTRSVDSEQGYLWESEGTDGYTIEPTDRADIGTEITLHVKADTDDETYSTFLEEYEIRSLIKKHSDFIRYPITLAGGSGLDLQVWAGSNCASLDNRDGTGEGCCLVYEDASPNNGDIDIRVQDIIAGKVDRGSYTGIGSGSDAACDEGNGSAETANLHFFLINGSDEVAATGTRTPPRRDEYHSVTATVPAGRSPSGATVTPPPPSRAGRRPSRSRAPPRSRRARTRRRSRPRR